MKFTSLLLPTSSSISLFFASFAFFLFIFISNSLAVLLAGCLLLWEREKRDLHYILFHPFSRSTTSKQAKQPASQQFGSKSTQM